jgi:hypothetical protein
VAATAIHQAALLARWGPFCRRAVASHGGGGGMLRARAHAAGAGAWCAVCMRSLAQRQHTASVAWRVGAGGGAMASRATWRLYGAAEDGDVARIAAALLAGADPNAFERTHGITPLHQAAINGRVAAIAALLAAGARVDDASRVGNTPLMLAVLHGSTAAVDALLAAGANVDHVNNRGNTALHWASMHGHPDATRVLLDAGVRTDVRNREGKRPVNVVRPPLARLFDTAAR